MTGERHGRGWERHAMCESALRRESRINMLMIIIAWFLWAFRHLVGYSQQTTAVLKLDPFASSGENLVSWPDTETCSHHWVHQSVWPPFHLKKERVAQCETLCSVLNTRRWAIFGITTRLGHGFDDSVFESRQGWWNFSLQIVESDSSAHPASYSMGAGVISAG